MGAINTYGQSIRKWPEKDSLFIKFQGPTESSISESIELAKEIVKRHGATGFEVANDREEAEVLWLDRKNAHCAGLALMPGSKSLPTDVWYVSLRHESASDSEVGSVFQFRSYRSWCMKRRGKSRRPVYSGP